MSVNEQNDCMAGETQFRLKISMQTDTMSLGQSPRAAGAFL